MGVGLFGNHKTHSLLATTTRLVLCHSNSIEIAVEPSPGEGVLRLSPRCTKENTEVPPVGGLHATWPRQAADRLQRRTPSPHPPWEQEWLRFTERSLLALPNG